MMQFEQPSLPSNCLDANALKITTLGPSAESRVPNSKKINGPKYTDKTLSFCLKGP